MERWNSLNGLLERGTGGQGVGGGGEEWNCAKARDGGLSETFLERVENSALLDRLFRKILFKARATAPSGWHKGVADEGAEEEELQVASTRPGSPAEPFLCAHLVPRPKNSLSHR